MRLLPPCLVQVRHLKAFRHFFDNDAFVYALLILTFISFLVLGLCDSPNNAKLKEEPKLRPSARSASGPGAQASKGGWGSGRSRPTPKPRGGSFTGARAGVTVVTKV